MKWQFIIQAACIWLASVLSGRADDIVTILSFTGTSGAYIGADPKGSLIRDGNTLYGFTSAGGSDNVGTIFSVNTDGTDYSVLASFSDASGDLPHHGYLTLDGTLIIRPVYMGGDNGSGTIFSVQTNGSNAMIDYSFTGSSTSPTSLGDGSLPHSGLLASPGGVYYGVTGGGGANGQGVIYSYNPTGTVTTVLYAFNGTTGGNAHGQFIWDSTNTLLLGMTRNGGTGTGNSHDSEDPAYPAPGVIFSYNPATNDYHVLYNFTSTGTTPYFTDHGDLTLGSGSHATDIFGITDYGGADDKGAIFSLSENGSSTVTLLHSFTGGGADGDHPFGSLVLGPDGFFYGMTRDGGANDDGTIFRISQDGTVYTVLASFDAATSGRNPIDNIVFSVDGTTLYGLANEGGADDHGTLFSLNIVSVPEPDNLKLLFFGTSLLLATTWLRRKQSR